MSANSETVLNEAPPPDVLAEIDSIGLRWQHQDYVPFQERDKVLRYARLGAALDQLTRAERLANTPIASELRGLMNDLGPGVPT